MTTVACSNDDQARAATRSAGAPALPSRGVAAADGLDLDLGRGVDLDRDRAVAGRVVLEQAAQAVAAG